MAARLAATRVASELGERPGKRIGYTVRFEDVSGPETRVRFVTEGVLLRRLLSGDPLDGVAVVILDEFHERHAQTDLCLTLLDRIRRQRTNAPHLLVMSATLNAGPVADYLGGAPRITTEGRAFDCEITYDADVDERYLENRVSHAVRDALERDSSGDLLVFLPGTREIQNSLQLLGKNLGSDTLEVLPLHGELSLKEQQRAVAPQRFRKIVLATNVAESSVTIDGVTTVIDSGLARVASYSSWGGRAVLELQDISQASAIQRAGRAGRTQRGWVRRLYTRGSFERRPTHDIPELLRSDLSEVWLNLCQLTGGDTDTLRFLERPAGADIDNAKRLLGLLGALADGSRLTPIGEQLTQIPLHPRLARFLISAMTAGVGEPACLAAALLSERDIRRRQREPADSATGLSDLTELMDLYAEVEVAEFSRGAAARANVDGNRLAAVRRSCSQLRRQLSPDRTTDGSLDNEEIDTRIRQSLLCGHIDRVARRKKPGSADVTLQSGSDARLSETSVVRDAPFVLALDLGEQKRGERRGTTVNVASAVEADWLLDLDDHLEYRDELSWNSRRSRVESVSRILLGSVTIEESRTVAKPSSEVSEVLAKAALSSGFGKQWDELDALRARLQLLSQYMPELDWPALSENPTAILKRACTDISSLADLESMDMKQLLTAQLDHAQTRALAEHTPDSIALPNGRRLEVHYSTHAEPWVGSRIQDFFGMTDGPTICGSRHSLTLHLQAPNGRAQQVTRDLSGFWSGQYGEVRKQLRGRYPKHPWPEDGGTAIPPKPRPPRRR